MQKALRKADFKKWLEKQDPNHRYNQASTFSCPIAAYYKDMDDSIFPVIMPDYRVIQGDFGSFKSSNPKWARCFIDKFDHCNDSRAFMALAFLEDC